LSAVIVVDTMIASAWLGTRQSERQARWAPILEPARWVLPFPVVAEMGHGLAAKDHEADRWIAAVSLAGDLPIATEDSIFEDVPGLTLLRP